MPFRRLVTLLVLSILAGSCQGDDQSSCEAQGCGESAICYNEVCLDLTGDADRDGLTNAQESSHGLDLLSPDTDLDGKNDGDEWGSGELPADRDGDGLPDALESSFIDSDGDCVPDESDPDGVQTDLQSPFLKAMVCPNQGVCAASIDPWMIVCLNGVLTCRFQELPPGFQWVESTCDGLDNDCDGETDEGIWLGQARLGESCVVEGVCGAGVVECNPESGAAVCSSAPGGSQCPAVEELCDGLDNDCDGATDEELTWNDLSLGSECDGPGVCEKGIVECHSSSGEVICSTMEGGSQQQAQAESCDGLDNDCDGETDEDLYNDELDLCPHLGVCGAFESLLRVKCRLGEWICDPSLVEAYSQGAELRCDGLDNDCDGDVDEDFAVLNPDGQQNVVGAPCGLGACAGGVVSCSADGMMAFCSTYALKVDEICDEVDNDCDGLVDEGQTYNGKALGTPCDGVGVCGAGTVECGVVSRKATCSTNPDGTKSEASTESCDLLDNDCDGLTDEGLEGVVPCSSMGVCSAQNATAKCLLGDWICDYGFLTDWEVEEQSCDGLDNDCDGFVDESLPRSWVTGQVVERHDAPGTRAWAAIARHPDGLGLFGGQSRALPDWGTPVARSDFWFFDASSGAWTRLADLPISSQSGQAAAWVGALNAWIVLGGRDEQGATAEALLVSWDGTEVQPLELPDWVTQRWGHSLEVRPGASIVGVFGGLSDGGPAVSAEVDLESLVAEELSQLPAMAFHQSCSLEDGAVWFFGGDTGSGMGAGDMRKFDWETGLVTDIDANGGPSPRSQHAMFALGGQIWVLGGASPGGTPLDDAWMFDPVPGLWKPRGQLPEGVAFPWVTTQGSPTVAGGLGLQETSLSWTASYHVESGLWEASGRLEPTVAGCGATDVLRRRSCFAGGFVMSAQGPVPLNRVTCLETGDTPLVDYPIPEEHPLVYSAMVYDPYLDRLLFIGSTEALPGVAPDPMSPVCAYLELDPETGAWADFSPCSEGPGAVAGAAASVWWKDMSLWVTGGGTPSGVSSRLWRFDLVTREWSLVGIEPPLPARVGHRAFLLEEEGLLVLLGGSPGGSPVVIDLVARTWTSLPGWTLGEARSVPLFFDPASRTGQLWGEDGARWFSMGDGLQGVTQGDADWPGFFGASTILEDPFRGVSTVSGGLDHEGLVADAWLVASPDCITSQEEAEDSQ